MAVNDPSKLNINEQSTVGSGSQGVTNPWGEGDKPTNIWTGMKRADAEQYNLLDAFNRANTNPDDVISEDEYNAYMTNNEHTEDIVSHSGKRTAVGGVYTVVKGDTLSKIAKDFGVDVYKLYQMNISVIGKNINSLQIGQQIRISAASNDDDSSDSGVSDSGSAQVTQGSDDTTTGSNPKLKPLVLSDKAKAALSEALGVDVSSLTPEELAQKAVSIDIEKLMKCFQIVMQSSDDKDLRNLMSVLTQDDAVATAVISAAKNLDTPEKMQQLVTEMSKALNIAPEELMKLSITELIAKIKDLDKGARTQLVKDVLIKVLGDSEAIHTAFKDHQGEITQEEFDDFYGLNSDAIKNETDPQKRMDLIVEAVGKKILADMNVQDPNSYVNAVIREIKSGNLTEYEKKAYAGADLTDNNVVLKIAMQRVHNAHTNIFASAMTEDIINNNLREFQVKLEVYVSNAVQEAFGDTDENGILAALAATVASYDETPDEYKTSISDVIAENSQQLGVDNLDDDFFAAITNVIFQNGSEESLNKYSQDNSNRSDIINEIVRNIQSNTTDPEKKSMYDRILQATAAASSNQGAAAQPVTQGNAAYASNPISNDYAAQVMMIRQASERRYGATGGQLTSEQMRQQQIEQLEEFRREIMSRVRVKMAELKNLPLGVALSEVLKHFDQMPGHVKERFINHLVQLASVHHDMACKAYIEGDDTLKQFLAKHCDINQFTIFQYFDEHESEIKFAPQTLQVAYYKYKSEENQHA